MHVLYLRPPDRRPIWVGLRPGLTDMQGAIPRFWCINCGAEVFTKGMERCFRCAKEEGKDVGKDV